MKYIANNTAEVLPIPNITSHKRAIYHARKEYYESKIKTLMDMNLPPKLILLACWDAPVERMDLSSKRNRKRFVKKCLKYYKQQLKEVQKEEKKL
jgi:hypothetical protein